MQDIHLKGVIMEDFVNYKVPSMFLITCKCDWKCCREAHCDISICQNEPMAQHPEKVFDVSTIYKAYINNNISQAVVIGGLEPFLQFDEVYDLIKYFRDNECEDTFVIYTGYNEDEIVDQINMLNPLKNIILKVGRYIPNDESRFDPILGINLVSKNQKAIIL